jgi:alkanesulfonate monooxygenase SsuD/methylene tetrahydromethanopterin reductase-like flavin-dependent oxidoreductase (luciferase family)
MQFGLFGGPGRAAGADGDRRGYRAFADYACRAEELGFVSAFLTEHHFTGLGQASSPLAILSHLAARTRTLRLGTAVMVLPWQHPLLLAEQAATLDVLSDGRLDLGVGRGFRAAEFDSFEVPAEEAAERYEEALELLLRAWTEPARWSHEGRFWRVRDVVVEPAPVQRPHPPIWVGAGSEPSLRAAARRGFRLLLDQVAGFEQTGERIAVYREQALELGRPYAAVRDVAVTRALLLVDGPRERAAAIAARVEWFARMARLTTAGRAPGNRMAVEYTSDIERATEDGAIIGDVGECVERLRALRDAGAEYVLLIEPGASPETLEVFAREVMPRLREREPAPPAPSNR